MLRKVGATPGHVLTSYNLLTKENGSKWGDKEQDSPDGILNIYQLSLFWFM